MPRDLPALTPTTARVGILGWPVEHSRSPAMHNAVHAELGIDAHYHRIPVHPDRVGSVVAALVRHRWRGVNVTVPHKQAVAVLVDDRTDEAELIGAVNTIVVERGRLVGDNTDARGWALSVERDTSWRPGDGAALLVGTGGAARAVAVALGRASSEVVVAGRRPAAANGLATLAERAGAPQVRSVDLADDAALTGAVGDCALVVNATTLGMHGERLPDPLHRLGSGHTVSDLVYGQVTPLVEDAREAGATAIDGLGMLAAQAALSFASWHGIDPPFDAFRRAVRPTG